MLVEGVHPETDHLLVARHHGQAPGIDGSVLINDGFALAGRFAEVEISAAWPDDLVGHIVGPIDGEGVRLAEATGATAESAPAGAL